MLGSPSRSGNPGRESQARGRLGPDRSRSVWDPRDCRRKEGPSLSPLQGGSFPRRHLCRCGLVFRKLSAPARTSLAPGQLSSLSQTRGHGGHREPRDCVQTFLQPPARGPCSESLQPGLHPHPSACPGLGGSPAGGGHQQSSRVGAPLGPRQSLPPSSAFIRCKSVFSFLCERRCFRSRSWHSLRATEEAEPGARLRRRHVETACWAPSTALNSGRRGQRKPAGSLEPGSIQPGGPGWDLSGLPVDREGPGTRTLAHGAPVEHLLCTLCSWL